MFAIGLSPFHPLRKERENLLSLPVNIAGSQVGYGTKTEKSASRAWSGGSTLRARFLSLPYAHLRACSQATVELV